MRTIRIFALPSHQTKERTSGVDFARIIQPMTYLNGYEYEDVKFKVDLYNIHAKKQPDWLNISKEYDLIYFNYINNPWAYAAMAAMAKKNGVKIVLDVDDALWNIKSDNPAHSVYKKGGEAIFNFNCIVNDVDLVTVTNPYLKHVLMNHTDKKPHEIIEIDNHIDLTKYDFKPSFKNDSVINLVHHGSTTHFNDLLEKEFVKGIDKIMAEYPNVNIHFIGAFVPYFRKRWGARYTNKFGHQDIHEWVKGKFREHLAEADIMITPLTEDIYNKAKSGIKFLENSSVGKPGVYQNLAQYQKYIKDGENGFLASTHQQWYKAIKKLIDDPKLRQEMGEKAFETAKEHTIQEHVKLYAQTFKRLLV